MGLTETALMNEKRTSGRKGEGAESNMSNKNRRLSDTSRNEQTTSVRLA